MKRTYYLIKVTQYNEPKNITGHVPASSIGYFTDTYKVNKGTFVGYDSSPDYSEVKRYTSEKAAQSKANLLSQGEYGNETGNVDYDFEVVELQLEPNELEQKEVVSRELNNIAKVYLKRHLISDIKGLIVDVVSDYEDKYTDEQYTMIEKQIYVNVSKMIQALGKINE